MLQKEKRIHPLRSASRLVSRLNEMGGAVSICNSLSSCRCDTSLIVVVLIHTHSKYEIIVEGLVHWLIIDQVVVIPLFDSFGLLS